MTTINIFERTGTNAENKDIARDIRERIVMPALAKGDKVTLNFENVNETTQSFIHALISDALRQYGDSAMENITFHKCNDTVRQLIRLVFDYMQEGTEKK